MTGSAARQLLIVLLAAAIAGAFPPLTLLSITLSVLAAWAGVNTAHVWSVPTPRWSRGQWLLAAAVLTLPLWTTAARTWNETLEHEGLIGVVEHLQDRARLTGLAIAPPLIVADQPQRFYLHATADELTVRFPEREVAAESLGHGLFRLEYDPRADGVFPPGEVSLPLVVDGTNEDVALFSVRRYAHPRTLVVAPDRRRAATVSEETDELFVVGTDLARREVLDAPSGCAFLPDGQLMVAHARDDTLLFRETLEEPTRLPLSRVLAVSANEEHVAIATRDHVSLLSAGALSRGQIEILFQRELPAPPDGLAIVDHTIAVAIRKGAKLLAVSADATHELLLSRPAVALTRGPANTVLLSVTDYREGGTRHLGNHFIDDQILTVEVTPRALTVTKQTRTQGRTPRQGSAGNVDRGVSPLGLHYAGATTYVAFAGTSELMIHRESHAPRHMDLPEPLAVPFSVAPIHTEEGPRLLVTAAGGRVGVLDANGELLLVHQLAPSDDALADEDEYGLKRRYGERVFYEATRAGVSCQSCHLHGTTDEAAHNIGERRLAPTLDVRGLMQTSPYLRDGSFPRLSDLEDLATDLYRGWARSAPSRGLTLEAYIAGLPLPPPPATSASLETLRRGAKVFVSARCVRCHTFPAFTSLGSEIAQTVFPESDPGRSLDTPSLLGVANSAPYFHDGRAATLQAVLDDNESDLHGETTSLSASDVSALLSFLEGL